MRNFEIIVACDSENGIGKKGGLPWTIHADMKYFKKITVTTASTRKRNCVIMGRKTWDSIPERFRPLPERLNIILTRNPQAEFPPGVLKFDDFTKSLEKLAQPPFTDEIETVFVIGGQQIFKEALESPFCKKLYVTHIDGSFGCDTFFPAYTSRFKKDTVSDLFEEGSVSYTFVEYQPTDR